jgi:heme exporter protein B
MSAKHEARRVAAIVWKDMTAERRSKAQFNAVVFLAGLMVLLFGFALGPDNPAIQSGAAGIIWLTILFSGVLTFHRSYEQELENSALEMLLLYPGERRTIFLGKVIGNLLFLLMVELVLIFVAVILYNIPVLPQLPRLLLVVLLGTIGFTTLGTFYAAMASRLRAREVLLPLLLFPMLVPLLMAAVGATGALLGGVMDDFKPWIQLLVVFDVIFFVAALFAFEYVIEE